MATETKKTKAPARKAAPAAKAAAGAEAAAAPKKLGARRTLVGMVTSNKMQKTIVVKIERNVRHGKYAKYVSSSNKFKAHDEKNEARIGDQVVIIESRPLSKDKRWALQRILRRAPGAPETSA